MFSSKSRDQEIELERKDRQIEDVRTKYQHNEEIRSKDYECKDKLILNREQFVKDTQALKDEISTLKITIKEKDVLRTAVDTQINYERENRKTLIEAEVSKRLGEAEVKYYHDLHTFMEGHTAKFNEFQQGFMKSVLDAIKELKPATPQLIMVGKDTFDVGQKVKDNQKENKTN